MCRKMIQILLATYNSRTFLAEQLDSLLTQENSCDIEILISDGGSNDNTLEIIEDFKKRYPGKIRFLGSRPASACQNFIRLISAADSELIMFCDHDDVWKKDKVRLSVEAYRKMEQQYGADMPLLIFTDSEVVDSKLKKCYSSMMRSQRLNMTRFTPGRTIIQNYASGNTMLFNRALQKIVLPVGNNAVMHDHWTALAASFFGKVCYVDVPTIYYRQHGKNVLGAFQYNFFSCLKKFIYESGQFRGALYRDLDQASEFLSLHKDQLTSEQQKLLAGLEHFKEMPWLGRCRFLIKHDILKAGILRNIGMFLNI